MVERVNRLMWQLGPPAMTTLAFLVLDPETETLELVSAGHPPPLVIAPGRHAEFLPLQGGVALGASPMAALPRRRRSRCPTGSTRARSTPTALVELRGESIDEGLERLRALADAARASSRRCATRDRRELVARARRRRRRAARRARPAARRRAQRPAGPPTRARSPPSAPAPPLAARARRDADETYDIIVACQEACANAVEHAYGPGGATFDVEARRDGGRVTSRRCATDGQLARAARHATAAAACR